MRTTDRPQAQAVVLTCMNLPGYEVVANLERELGKPVLTAAQALMWAALGAVDRAAVGPGQALVRCRVPDGHRPVLRVVGPREPADRTGTDGAGADGDGPAPLHKVRVRLPDESGALARLAAAVAETGGNILGLAVHGQDGHSVVDELLVGGPLPAAGLAATVRSVLGPPEADTVLVAPADPHELVDAPTRALDLAAGARDTGEIAAALAVLLHADSAEVRATGNGRGESGVDGGHELDLPAPDGRRLVVRRVWAPFTVTERARAEAYLRAVLARPVRHHVLLPGGEEIGAAPATGDEIAELDRLLRTCLAGTVATGTPAGGATWTAADLRALLLPPGGSCLLARSAGGELVALGALLPAETPEPPAAPRPGAGPEPVLLVHPRYRGHGLVRWLRRRLHAGDSERPVPAV